MNPRLTRRERRQIAREQKKLAVPVAETKPSCWYWLGPCIAAVLIYFPSFSFDFIHDDIHQIVENPQVQSWKYLGRLLTTDAWSQMGLIHNAHYYRPLFSVWMLVVHTAVGLDVGLWHISNGLLHAVATYLVYRVCLELLSNRLAALVGALLFALHPIHVESVSWVSASDEMLYAIFFLGSLVCLMVGLRSGKSGYLVSSVVLWACSLFSKENAISLLPVLVAIAALRRSNLKRLFALTGAYVAVCAAYLAARSFALHGLFGQSVSHGVFTDHGRTVTMSLESPDMWVPSWSETVYSIPGAASFYLKKLVWPSALSPIYHTQIFSRPTPQVWMTVLILGLICIGAMLVIRRSSALATAGALISLPLVPVLVGIHFFMLREFVHDRYLFLPSAGLAVVLAYGCQRVLASSRAVKCAAATLLLAAVMAYSWESLNTQSYYSNSEALCSRAREMAPEYTPCQMGLRVERTVIKEIEVGSNP